MGIIVNKLSVACLCLALVSWLGCSSANKTDDTASVQRAVEKHLATRTDLGNLQVVVEKVSFEGDHANAAVTIMARQDSKAKMQMTYRLRKTDAGWEVEAPQGSEAGAHAGGAVPMPEAEGGGAELPPGHPPVKGGAGGEASELPPGHPPVEKAP
jgi:hypothetical protein